MNPTKKYQIRFNGKVIESKSYYPGLLDITLPVTNTPGVLTIDTI